MTSTTNGIPGIVPAQDVVQEATGFRFTEGPVWHPDGWLYFVDVLGRPTPRIYRLLPGNPGLEPEVVREDESAADGLDFDMDGNLLLCETRTRRVTRLFSDGHSEVLAERYQEKRLNRPNDLVCRSDGSIFFSDPGLNAPFAQRELPQNGLYCINPAGELSLIADCEHPNGMCFSEDERVLFLANTRWAQYIQRFEINPDGSLKRRGIFADMSSDEAVGPDGIALDTEGRLYATGAGGTWVFDREGRKLGIFETPELPANLCFGGDDMKTLFLTARSSVYSVRVETPGLKHPFAASKMRS